jgi:hypothetical protein
MIAVLARRCSLEAVNRIVPGRRAFAFTMARQRPLKAGREADGNGTKLVGSPLSVATIAGIFYKRIIMMSAAGRRLGQGERGTIHRPYKRIPGITREMP